MLNSKNIRKLFKEDEFAKLFDFFGCDKDSSKDELQSLAEMLNELMSTVAFRELAGR